MHRVGLTFVFRSHHTTFHLYLDGTADAFGDDYVQHFADEKAASAIFAANAKVFMIVPRKPRRFPSPKASAKGIIFVLFVVLIIAMHRLSTTLPALVRACLWVRPLFLSLDAIHAN